MKKYMPLLLVTVFLVVLCGAPEGPTTETPTTKKPGEDIAFGTLTEVELQKFIKAAPVFKTEVEKEEKEWEAFEPSDNVGSWLGQFSKLNQDITGLDTKLRGAGMPWDEFWPAFAKTMTAVIAITLDKSMSGMKEKMEGNKEKMAEMEAKLEDPNVPDAEKEMIEASLGMMKKIEESMAEVQNLYAKVPQVNKDIVQKHWNELAVIMELEEE